MSLFGALAAGLDTPLSSSALAANTAPAIVAFDRAFAAINDYTCVLHVHEAKGSETQDRVYQYSFMKPHYAKTLILDGDGKGSGGVWAGTDQISGHQGGFLSGLHMKVDVHDRRAVSLRGVTIPEGLLQHIVEMLRHDARQADADRRRKSRRGRHRSARPQGRRPGRELRRHRTDPLSVKGYALARAPDHVFGPADRARRVGHRSQNQHGVDASRLPVLGFPCHHERAAIARDITPQRRSSLRHPGSAPAAPPPRSRHPWLRSAVGSLFVVTSRAIAVRLLMTQGGYFDR